MATAETKLLTADEFYEFANRAENRGKVLELERGELVEMSRPGKLHGFICGNATRVLGNFSARRKKGYVCSNDTGVVVESDPDTVRGPDLLFFEDTDEVDLIERKYGRSPATLAVEVLSPNDTPGKVNRRVMEQLRFGTKLVWVIDLEAKNITVYRAGKEYYLVEEHEELTGDDVLPDFRCRAAEFFQLPWKVE